MTVPVPGCPSLEESYPSLPNQSSTWAKQGEVRGQECAPARRIGSVSLVAHGPRPFHSALAVGLLSVNEATVPETRQDGSQHLSLFLFVGAEVL